MKILCVTNQALCKGDYLQQLQKIAAAKLDAMILREKQLSETAYQALAEQVQRICQEQGVQLICNHQISVAEHLSLPVQVSVSQLEQASTWSVPFGVSVHKLEEAKQAEYRAREVERSRDAYTADAKKRCKSVERLRKAGLL